MSGGEAASEAWRRLPSPVGGTVAALAATPGGHILAGTLGGLFRAPASLLAWSPVAGGPRTVLSLAVHPQDGRLLFAGGAEGVWRSTDGGRAWSLALAGPPVTAVAAGGDSVILAATDGDGMFRSENEGRDWQAANAGLLDLDVTALALDQRFGETGIAHAGTATGLYRSINSGKSWRQVDLAGDDELAVTALCEAGGLLFAGSDGHGLFRSDDAGQGWDRVAETANTPVNAIAAGDGHRMAAATAAGVFFTADGVRFEPLPAPPAPVLALAIRGDSVLTGLAGLGVWRLDGGRWTAANAGLAGVRVASLTEAGAAAAVLAIDGTIHLATGDGWRTVATFAGKAMEALAVSGRHLWAIVDGALEHSADAGGSWNRMAGGATALASTSGGVVAAMEGGIAMFAPDAPPQTFGPSPAGPVRRLVAPAGPAGPLLCATSDGGSATVWHSRDGGGRWEALAEIEEADQVHLAAACGPAGALMVAAAGTRIVLADPLEAEPALRMADIAPAEVRDIAVAAAPSGLRVFVATDQGLLESGDGGATLESAADAPGSPVAVAVAGGGIHLATAAGEIFVRTAEDRA